MRLLFGLILILQIPNYCNGQVEFNQCKLFEDFFNMVRFDEIPYFTQASPKPKSLLSQAKDTLIESINYETYETVYINQKELLEQQWKKFNKTEKYIRTRNLDENSYHIVNLDIELRTKNEIEEIIKTSFPEIDSLIIKQKSNTCSSFQNYKNQNFKLNKSLNNLSIEEQFHLRGYFRFGFIFLTKDKKHAITTFDIYHKWLNRNGEETGMETGGGGIIIIDLRTEQKIQNVKYLSEY